MERRRDRRFRASLKVSLLSKEFPFEAVFTDVSLSGAKIIVKSPFTLGQVVECSLRIPDGSMPAANPGHLRGEVIWARRLDDRFFEIGLRFSGIGYDMQHKLIDHTYYRPAAVL